MLLESSESNVMYTRWIDIRFTTCHRVSISNPLSKHAIPISIELSVSIVWVFLVDYEIRYLVILLYETKRYFENSYIEDGLRILMQGSGKNRREESVRTNFEPVCTSDSTEPS